VEIFWSGLDGCNSSQHGEINGSLRWRSAPRISCLMPNFSLKYQGENGAAIDASEVDTRRVFLT
jgi:hypothetical protein